MHPVAQMSRVGQAGGHHIARRHIHALDPDLALLIQTEHVEGLQDADKLVAQPILEGDALGLHPTRHKQDFLVLHIHHLHFADLGEIKGLRLRERFRGEPAFLSLIDHGRVQTFLNGGPDGKVRRKFITVNGDVRPVTDANLLDFIEEMILGITGKYIGHAGFHAKTDEGQQAFLLPIPGLFKLIIAQFDAHLMEWVGRIRL